MAAIAPSSSRGLHRWLIPPRKGPHDRSEKRPDNDGKRYPKEHLRDNANHEKLWPKIRRPIVTWRKSVVMRSPVAAERQEHHNGHRNPGSESVSQKGFGQRAPAKETHGHGHDHEIENRRWRTLGAGSGEGHVPTCNKYQQPHDRERDRLTGTCRPL